jgi:hypothetical protein
MARKATDKVKKANVFVVGSLSMAGIVPLEKLPVLCQG